ncbi:serine/threonine-protein kinase prk-2-like [Cyanistes caeruleus]|uniref:serine/threonine-protein kinase prk-2-like n=1 Tax=Cyanistes caeruleus TaxID=156563 RepID=UPI000CDB8C85|nr:serine/threonine-protein kinase prk-2-like [Cyanistes caeruleus]
MKPNLHPGGEGTEVPFQCIVPPGIYFSACFFRWAERAAAPPLGSLRERTNGRALRRLGSGSGSSASLHRFSARLSARSPSPSPSHTHSTAVPCRAVPSLSASPSPAYAASRKAPVGESAPGPPLSGLPRSHLGQVLSALLVAPLEEFLEELLALRVAERRGVLHRDIKAENIVLDLATGEAKLIDFGCGTILRDTLYTRMSGTPEYRPPEWILFGCYRGQPATIWSLGILLYNLVCGHLPFHTNEDIIRGQLFFPPRVSQECQHLIRWCLSMDPADRPSLEDLLEHSWLQDPHLAQETAEIHPSKQWGDPGAQQVPAARVSWRSKKIPEGFPAAVEQRRERSQDASAGPWRVVEGAAQCSPSCWRSRDIAVKLPWTGKGETSPCSSMAS